MRKSDLPVKPCPACGRPMVWRKRWDPGLVRRPIPLGTLSAFAPAPSLMASNLAQLIIAKHRKIRATAGNIPATLYRS